MNWQHKVKIKHFFTDNEDYNVIKAAMANVADELAKTRLFPASIIKPFRQIKRGDSFFTAQDYANKALEKLYDFADDNAIWIE